MRLPVTDKFLWDLYNLLEKADDAFETIFPSRRYLREVRYHDLYNLWRRHEKEKSRKYFSQFIYNLKKRGYIKIKNLEQKQGVLLAKRGMEKVLKARFKINGKRKRRDGKWLMVIFDIPERKRKLRDLLREYLQLLGYKMLQKSIWVCPYDVYKETEGIIRRYSLDQYVKSFLIEEIEI